MTLSLRYAARSDVGLLREGNEDSGYAGSSLLVVADGLGGHAAGEVASAVAVSTLAELDGGGVGGDRLRAELSDAVGKANDQLRQLVDEQPGLEGMGTTLTALLCSDQQLGVVHVGDSRAYLLREDTLTQITRDHTFVQTLVDEGRITEDEAHRHPQRSLLMRALDGRSHPELDLSVREMRAGDRYLICSDGLSGVVANDEIAATLAAGEPSEVAQLLIEQALRAGGPDNVTVVVADVVETDEEAAATAAMATPIFVGAAADRRSGSAGDTAGHPLVEQIDEESDERGFGGRKRSRFRRVILVLAVLGLVGGGGWGAYAWSQQQYYVGVEDGLVTIFRGLPQEVAGASLSSTYERQDVELSDLPQFEQEKVKATISGGNLEEARTVVDRLRAKAADCIKARTPVTPAPAATAAPTVASPEGPTAPATAAPNTPAVPSPGSTGTGDCEPRG